MSSVFDQAFTLSQAICDEIIAGGITKINALGTSEIHKYCIDPLNLLYSFGVSQPNKASLVVFDSPRASKRVVAKLFSSNEEGFILKRDVAHNDPNYKFLHTANMLAYARLINRVLSNDGILIAITTPEVYLTVRGAFEHFIGSDKFIGELVYQSRSGGGADSTWLSTDHETMLIFSKNPQLISRFQITKGDSELKKYNQKDSLSAYYWDTYIRKNARNYYGIQAPDGSILELDEDGNKISWLWRKQTFLEKLEAGDVKFEKQNDKWRLYYKDRQKDVKILRSLTLNATLLKEIDDSLASDDKGADLLNSKGSEEIKSFSGIKPDYLKPSGYFKFIFTIFNKSNGSILIPLPDFGAAAAAFSAQKNTNNTLIINNSTEYNELINWRMNHCKNEKVILSNNGESFKIASFFNASNNSKENLTLQLISIKYSLPNDWNDYDYNGIVMNFNRSLDVGFLNISKVSPEKLQILGSTINTLFDEKSIHYLHIFSEIDTEIIENAIAESIVSFNISYNKVPAAFI